MASSYNIAVLPGDGTGPEVVDEALKVLKAVAGKYNKKFDFTDFNWGGENYKATGVILPEDGIETLKKYDAILLGAIGHPDVKPGILEKGLLLALRFGLDHYINLRPVQLYPGVWSPIKDKGPEDIDFVVVRENTEGLYAGAGGNLKKDTPDEVAIQTSINTRKGVERCLRYAFEYCRKRDRKKTLTLVAKTNVLTYASDLWERAFHEIGDADYPDIKRDYAHVDATCMWMVKNPEWFDVLVVENMFGDIITDLGAMIQGGMGIAAGGNINPEGVSMYEPIGGSAPKYTGLNVINPLAAICSAAMMLEDLGEAQMATDIYDAVKWACANKMENQGAGKMGYGTREVGDLIAEQASK